MEAVKSRWLLRQVSQNMLPEDFEGGETVRETAYVTFAGVLSLIAEAGGSVMSPFCHKSVLIYPNLKRQAC